MCVPVHVFVCVCNVLCISKRWLCTFVVAVVLVLAVVFYIVVYALPYI